MDFETKNEECFIFPFGNINFIDYYNDSCNNLAKRKNETTDPKTVKNQNKPLNPLFFLSFIGLHPKYSELPYIHLSRSSSFSNHVPKFWPMLLQLIELLIYIFLKELPFRSCIRTAIISNIKFS